MVSKYKNLIFSISVVFLAIGAPSNKAFAMSVCQPAELVVGFFNGVWNTREQAGASLERVEGLSLDTDYQSLNFEYELFYNQTTSTFGDLAEVFIQRSAEMDGALANRWEAAALVDLLRHETAPPLA